MQPAVTQSIPQVSSRRYKSRYKRKPKVANALDTKSKVTAYLLAGVGILLVVALGVIAHHVMSPAETLAIH